jgi:3-oxoacyl-[acyl-carrier-protein] synthase III
MASFSINNIVLRGVAACVPSSIALNSSVEYIDQKELQLLIRTVGVQQRRLVNHSTFCSDLCLRSAEELLQSLQWRSAQIDILIFVSQSRNYVLPCTAILLQEKLGLPKSTLAFDIPLGCSGYTYGLSVISSMMASCGFKRGLLLCGDLSTNVINTEGKRTFPLFGDAGTATALEYMDKVPPFYFNAGSDGSRYQAIILQDKRERADQGCELNGAAARLNNKQGNDLVLDGPKVFEFSITEVPGSINKVLEDTSLSTKDIDYFIMHQANLLMNETIRKKCRFTSQQTPYSLPTFGNTSSASIPLTMVTELKNDLERNKRRLLMTGFGVGLSWATAVIETNNLCIPQLIDYD